MLPRPPYNIPANKDYVIIRVEYALHFGKIVIWTQRDYENRS
jgi:hypothetical protein